MYCYFGFFVIVPLLYFRYFLHLVIVRYIVPLFYFVIFGMAGLKQRDGAHISNRWAVGDAVLRAPYTGHARRDAGRRAPHRTLNHKKELHRHK